MANKERKEPVYCCYCGRQIVSYRTHPDDPYITWGGALGPLIVAPHSKVCCESCKQDDKDWHEMVSGYTEAELWEGGFFNDW